MSRRNNRSASSTTRLPDSVLAPDLSNNLPTGQRDLSCASGGDAHVMGDDNQGRAKLVVEFEQQVDDRFGGSRVEIAGRFVGEQNIGRGAKRAGQGDALLLAAGELTREMLHSVGEANSFEHCARCIRCVWQIFQFKREHDIFKRSETGDEMECLEHEAYVAPTQPGAGVLIKCCQIMSKHANGACRNVIEPGKQSEQGRFSRTRYTRYSDALASGDGKVDIIENAQFTSRPDYDF